MPIVASKESDAKGRDLADFDSVMREHQRRIYRFLYAMLRDSDDANTLTQECFLRAFRNWSSFRGESSVATWLTRIAVNLVKDHRRDRRLAFWRRLFASDDRADLKTISESQPALRSDPEREILAKEKASAIWKMVEKLPMQQRAVFTLRFAEEMSICEIALAMQLEQGTVKSHLSRALSTVRKIGNG